MPRLPGQGDREPWRNPQNDASNSELFGEADVDAGTLLFGGPVPA